jgi:hypothetical protein
MTEEASDIVILASAIAQAAAKGDRIQYLASRGYLAEKLRKIEEAETLPAMTDRAP